MLATEYAVRGIFNNESVENDMSLPICSLLLWHMAW
jgi:hypothetical protein